MDYFSPAAITDGTGAIAERYRFSAFGNRTIMTSDWDVAPESESDFVLAFHGQLLDVESGFLNYGYRFYSPRIGRWLSKDPITSAGENNLYAFVKNMPLQSTDRFGLQIGIEYQDLSDILPRSPQPPGSFIGTADNWTSGSAKDAHLSFSDYDPGWGPYDFSEFQAAVDAACLGNQPTTHIQLTKNRDLYREGYSTILEKGGPGRYNLVLEGDISVDQSTQTWTFSGRIYAPPDRVDFDPRPWGERTRSGEFITRLVNRLHNMTGVGADFTFYFDGDRHIDDDGCCPSN